jgi:hypothetical protein
MWRGEGEVGVVSLLQSADQRESVWTRSSERVVVGKLCGEAVHGLGNDWEIVRRCEVTEMGY